MNSDSSEETGFHDLSAHPHDAFFKKVFSQPEHAVAFFKGHLPAEVVGLVRWEELQLLPGSFVNTDLRQAHSDLLFSVPLRAIDVERDILLHLIFEHQTTVQACMPLRTLGYQVDILERHYREHGLPLPPVIGLVLHQGPDCWTVSTSLEDLFQLPAEIGEILRPYLPCVRHALLDLSQFDPGKEEDNERMKVVLKLMKMAREKDLLQFFSWLVEEMATMVTPLPDPLLTLALFYALNTDEQLDIEALTNTVRSQKQLSKLTMTTLEKILAEGEVRGMAKGKAEGKAEGVWIGKIQMIRDFLGEPPAREKELASLSELELEEMFTALQHRYDSGFKGR